MAPHLTPCLLFHPPHRLPHPPPLHQDRWLDNRECAYVQGSELGEGERRLRRFAPFSDGIKNCLGQVRTGRVDRKIGAEKASLTVALTWTSALVVARCWQH